MTDIVSQMPLGQKTLYPNAYNPNLLYPIERSIQRQGLKFQFEYGYDRWMAYELSWLHPNGIPCVAIGVFEIPCTSPCIIESKSMKLYLNSYNQTHFVSAQAVQQHIEQDLSKATQSHVRVRVLSLHEAERHYPVMSLKGTCIDTQDIQIEHYNYHQDLLACSPDEQKHEILISHLLKSNCLVTQQPDWASVRIEYQGPSIDHASLLRYLISFRGHQEFHEHCVERIFSDMMNVCGCINLSVTAYFTRRGGIDIVPIRSNTAILESDTTRLVRQ